MSTVYGTLKSWNFISNFNKWRTDLIGLACLACTLARKALSKQPSPSDCLPILERLLEDSVVWQGILNSKRHAKPSMRPIFTSAMASYLLSEYWGDVKDC